MRMGNVTVDSRKRGVLGDMAEEQSIALLRQARDALEAYLFANEGACYEAVLALCDRISEHLSGKDRQEGSQEPAKPITGALASEDPAKITDGGSD